MYMTEGAALKCSKQPDDATFEEAHNDGRLCFPIVSSTKIMRKKAEDCSVISGAAVRLSADNFYFGFVKVAPAKVPERQR